ncbi:thiamine biosynthesis protein ThiI [Halovenus aranensis]|uniref:Probable tRNA sulfurtransferase n=1 Tax=Halovenus aranensis TaxID=890420 RepID=A0A1G8S6Z4_9EURY|nr:tRNA sulfurtransferase [Halovenus aranensis]SDJ24953.1 thiamine biosynthesis protein ThiI [Halovenus aranensis]
MHPPGADTVLVRFSGEVGVKSQSVQQRMERQLRTNLRRMLDQRAVDATVEAEFTRLYVRTDPDQITAATRAARSVFGVSSVSPVRESEPTMAAICDLLREAARERYDGGTFAVRARRAGQPDAHPFSSTDIEREGGSAVAAAAEATGVDPVVDLDDPELTFGVECRPERAFVYLDRQSGPGGLPLGTQEPVVALVSGGIDSPVAAWELMKRGCPVIPVYVDLGRFGGVDHRARAERTMQCLTEYTPDGLTLWAVPGGEGLKRITEAAERYRMLLARRFMLRIGAAVADRTDAVGVVTGESVGQKSSQTSAALRVTGAAIDYPVHRPLVSLDKSEITERARAIGTYDEATIDAGCHRLAPDNPATQPPLSTVREVEPADGERLATEAVENAEQVAIWGESF